MRAGMASVRCRGRSGPLDLRAETYSCSAEVRHTNGTSLSANLWCKMPYCCKQARAGLWTTSRVAKISRVPALDAGAPTTRQSAQRAGITPFTP